MTNQDDKVETRVVYRKAGPIEYLFDLSCSPRRWGDPVYRYDVYEVRRDKQGLTLQKVDFRTVYEVRKGAAFDELISEIVDDWLSEY